MATQRKNANQLTASKKRKIYKLFYEKDATIPQIAEYENVTYWQVYRIVNGQTKIDGSARSDKGSSRSAVGKDGDIIEAKWSIDDFKDLDDFQLFLLMSALEDAATSKLSPSAKVALVKDIEIVQTKITQRQLKGNIKRPEAEVIARIIRRFKPDATDVDIINIYTEEMELYIKGKRNG